MDVRGGRPIDQQAEQFGAALVAARVPQPTFEGSAPKVNPGSGKGFGSGSQGNR